MGPPTMPPTSPVGRFVVDGQVSTWFASQKLRMRKADRRHKPGGTERNVSSPAMNDAILQEISDFCRQTGLAESTFGRRAVNDGKLASRLRNGGRITTDTLERIRTFMARNSDGVPAQRRVLFEPTPPGVLPVVKPPAPPVASGLTTDDPQRNFRF